MRLKGYYSSGQFAKLASVSVRTIRFYDTQNILKPSMVNENGARFYTDEDLKKLQQILLLKYLGFSLEDIRQILHRYAADGGTVILTSHDEQELLGCSECYFMMPYEESRKSGTAQMIKTTAKQAVQAAAGSRREL